MKKMLRSLLATAAAVLALASCQRQENDAPAAEGRLVRFIAGPVETRTAFSAPDATGQYPVRWTENDTKVKVSLNLASALDAEVAPASDGASAKFTATFKTDGVEAPYTFYALSPQSAFTSVSNKYLSWGFSIPADQEPGAGSPDEAAQVLAGVSAACASLDEEIVVNFSHVTAYGRLTLSNLDLADVEVTGISLTAEKPLAGRFYYYVADTDGHTAGEVEAHTASNTLNLTTDRLQDVWFACAPADLSGTSLKVTVNTANGPVEKTVSIPAGRKFESGKIAKFTVDMTGAQQKEQKIYELVTDPAKLTVGSEVVIANAAGTYAVGTTQNTNNRVATAVTVTDGKIVDPSESVEILTLAAGSKTGSVAFKTADGKYLTSESGNNRLKSSEKVDAYSSFTVAIADGVATVDAVEGENCQMRFNENNGSPIFNCYKVSSSTGTLVALYRLVKEGEEETPVFQATLAGASESGILEVGATETSATLSIVANVDWIVSGDGVTFSQEEGNSSATVEITFPANETDQVKTYTINLESDLGEFEFVINQSAKAVVGESVYKKVTSVTSGKKYIIAAFVDGKVQALTPIASDKTYGSAAATQVSETDGVIETRHEDLEFTFTAVSDGFSVLQPDGRYLAMSGTFNSFNVYDTAKESYIWAVTAHEDNTVQIQNVDKNKSVMFDSGHSNFASYANFGSANVWPSLYEYDGEGGETPVVETVATPTFSPAAGAVAAGTVVTISCATTGATIHYTTDGSTPTASSATGTSVTVNAAMTLKAIAVKEGMNDSAVAETAYTVTGDEPTGENYVKVSAITSGKKYIIVGGTTSKAMVPATLSSATRLSSTDVTITSGTIASTASTDALAVTITASGSGYTIGYNNVYLVYPGDGTGLKTSSTASSTWVVSAASATTGTFRFTTSNVDTRALAFRRGTQNTFGAYATSNISGQDYFDIDLYELGGEGGTTDPTVPATVTFTNGTSKSMTVGETFANPATTNSTATVTYSSSNEAVATVDAQGTVTAVASGTAVITASVAAVEGAFTAGQTTCDITVTSAPTGDEVIDLLTASDFDATGTSYVESTGIKKNSDALYYGKTATSHNAIQLRSNNSDCGVVSTTSGGKVKSVRIKLNSNTAAARVVDVYGSNTAYTNAADLYGNNKGTKMGSVAMTDGEGTVTFTADYKYVGLRSNNGAVYIDEIEITWE